MASLSKKTDKTSSRKKKRVSQPKTAAKKPQRRKKQGKKGKKTSHLKRNMVIILLLLSMISLVAFGYFLGQQGKEVHTPVTHMHKTHHTKSWKNEFSKLKTKKPKEAKKDVLKKHTVHIKANLPVPLPVKHESSDTKEKKPDSKIKVETEKKVLLASQGNKPRLVIIIDDVHTFAQLHAIQKLKLHITPSIFPPYKLATRSHLLAKGLKHYMIHLPMESGNTQFNTQSKTLKTTFSKVQIEARLKEIRRLFPTARYINNHTGSVFTANYRAMKTFYRIMKKEGFVFIDSRTTGRSKVKRITHEFGDAYVARDVFIDNVQTIPAIHKQLQKAVKIAKMKGYAIAIGHPHDTTIKALFEAKNILKDVQLVYIDEIYQK